LERLEKELEEIVNVLEGGESFKVVYKRAYSSDIYDKNKY